MDMTTAQSQPQPRLDDFDRVTSPFRRELIAHCYRMVGSVHDAEDVVQETYTRAWRAYDRFEGRSSVRTWLYRIATMACLRSLEQRNRRPLPSGIGAPSDNPDAALFPAPEVPWLEPLPDALVSADPVSVAAARESTRLAFVAALQLLPARQRAVLILRDVVRWRATEVATLLDTTTAAVNSLLQRARGQLAEARLAEDMVVEPTDPERRVILDRYVTAIENADMQALAALLREDVVIEMPPNPEWFVGAETCRRFLSSRIQTPGDLRLIPTSANGQPAFGHYRREQDGTHRAYAIGVLTLTSAGIARISVFMDPRLVAACGLPETLA